MGTPEEIIVYSKDHKGFIVEYERQLFILRLIIKKDHKYTKLSNQNFELTERIWNI